jgi:hypothetical protein
MPRVVAGQVVVHTTDDGRAVHYLCPGRHQPFAPREYEHAGGGLWRCLGCHTTVTAEVIAAAQERVGTYYCWSCMTWIMGAKEPPCSVCGRCPNCADKRAGCDNCNDCSRGA